MSASSNKRVAIGISALNRGFTLVELMVAMTISMLILISLVSVFVNSMRSQNEIAGGNGLIESGRYAIQILQEDIVHSGFWGGYVPGFDDLNYAAVPGDMPVSIPNPCAAYSTWDSNYRSSLIGMPIQSSDVLPTGSGCVAPLTKKADTDVLVVRHADTCVPGVGNCAVDVAGRLYFQPGFCAAERNAGVAQSATSQTITLSSSAAATNNVYKGLTIRTVSGTGAGQYRAISAYDGSTRVATLSTPWSVSPDGTTAYAFEYMFGTTSFPLHQRTCVGSGSPQTLPVSSGPIASKRQYQSNIYYITDIAHPDKAGEFIPALVRSRFDFFNGSLAQLAPEVLIEGIEGFRVELGIDNLSDTGAAVDYTGAVNWTDPTTKTSPSNRGDGAPDAFVRCTAGTPCTGAELSNVVALKLYVLVRTRDPAPGYTDIKEYCLGELDAGGACPAANLVGAFNDGYKRHVFTTSMRLTNISGRRETP